MMVKTGAITTAVQNLWTNGEFPVEASTDRFFLASDVWRKGADVRCARAFVARFACLRRHEA
jgi:hypothetical protein